MDKLKLHDSLHCDFLQITTLPVWLNDFLSVAHGSVPILHVETDAHGLIHHVQHVDVGVSKYGAHLLLAELTHLQ